MSVLTIEHASIGYEGKVLVRDLNLSLQANSFLVIVGENGIGKSTLLKSMLGFHPLMEGEITLQDSKIGYLAQAKTSKRDFCASVLEVVVSGCCNQKHTFFTYSKKQTKLAIQLLRLFDLQNLAHRRFSELSGGQQQRVLLARALCASRKLLLLDEPTNHLDPNNKELLYDCIDTVQEKLHGTIIMVSHDKEALKKATHVLHLYQGGYIFLPKEQYLQTRLYQYYFGGELC